MTSSPEVVWPGGKTYDNMDGIASPFPLQRGQWECDPGWFWAWPVDGYYDLHFVSDKSGDDHPRVDEIVGEGYSTLTECRDACRYETKWSRNNAWWYKV